MTERRFNEEEVAAIFERASEAEHTSLPASADGKGMTLAALQDIGREVGISPEAIARAALSLDKPGGPASRSFIGFPMAVGRTIEFPRPISDADWERLVGDLRQTFQARGVIRYDGPFRQWTNGNLQALVEPTPTGHRLRLQTMHGGARQMMTVGLVAMGMSAALGALVVAGINSARSLGVVAFIGTMGLTVFGMGALRLPGWARRRKAQFEELAARLAISAAGPPAEGSSSDKDPSRAE